VGFLLARIFGLEFILWQGFLFKMSPPEDRPRKETVHPMPVVVLRFLNDESGATAIEYGLIAAGISIAIIAAVKNIGITLNTKFTSVNTQLR
jgi:pilus assembly protein Flp/PilA